MRILLVGFLGGKVRGRSDVCAVESCVCALSAESLLCEIVLFGGVPPWVRSAVRTWLRVVGV